MPDVAPRCQPLLALFRSGRCTPSCKRSARWDKRAQVLAQLASSPPPWAWAHVGRHKIGDGEVGFMPHAADDGTGLATMVRASVASLKAQSPMAPPRTSKITSMGGRFGVFWPQALSRARKQIQF